MLLGDFLYSLNRTESRSDPVIQRAIGNPGASASATQVNVDGPTVPLDKVFILTHLTVTAIGGGAQTCSNYEVNLRDSSGNNLNDMFVENFTAANRINRNFAGLSYLLMPAEKFQLRTFFSAAAIANQAGLSFHGFYVPKGNLQLR